MNRIKPKKLHTRDFKVRRPLQIEEHDYHRIVDGLFASIGWDVGLKPRSIDSLGVSLLTQQVLTSTDNKSKRLRNCSSLALRSRLSGSLPETATQTIEATVNRAFTYQPMQNRTFIGLELVAPEVETERTVLNQTLMEMAGVEYFSREYPVFITLGSALSAQRIEGSLDRVGGLVGGTLTLRPVAFTKGAS